MCLDIDPDSVIHKHLNQKITNLTTHWDQGWENPILSWQGQDPDCDESHKLIMLPSFHISLGAPPKSTWLDIYELNMPVIQDHLHQLIGGIALANIHVSEHLKIKKSAFIKLPKFIIPRLICPEYFGYGLINEDFEELVTNKHEYHISLANLTGNPHDSIARPEDCVIDTIKN